jgi:hypothetical protein
VGFHDSFDDRQPETSTTMCRRMPRFEHCFTLLDRDSWPIVFDKDSLSVVTSNTDCYVRSAVFDGGPE